ncbi:MAG: MFS transporter [Candidatus Eremiobacteraeota bacterium]|nr:MFS transporter [Candidatus Eremiobacteraeota bacterium]
MLVVSALFFEIALNLPVGSMPLALTQDGASRAAVAVAMGCGMFAALFGSLPIGALTDRIGRLATIRGAALVGTLSMLGLAFAHGALLGGALLALRSIAVVAYMTAEFAYASELASKDRAVSGVATLGMIGNLTFATAPALGVFLWQHGVGREQYLWSAALAAAGLGCMFLLPKRHDVRLASTRRAPLFMHPRWLPAVGFAASATLQGGVNGSLAILTFHDRGIANGALIFTASAAVSFLLRYPAGRLVDRFGPRAIAVPVAIVQGAGCVLAAEAHSVAAVLLAGACLGFAWSAVVPVALGLLFEHSTSNTRGAAMGAYSLAFSGGAALGAVVATLSTLAGAGYPLAIVICAIAPLLALPAVVRSRRSTRAMTLRAAVTTSS